MHFETIRDSGPNQDSGPNNSLTSNSSSNSQNGGRQNWYFYDPRFAPGNNNNQNLQNFFHEQTTEHGIVAPPTYDEAANQQTNNNQPIPGDVTNLPPPPPITSTVRGPPPPYWDNVSLGSGTSDPPTYEQALYHTLLASNLGPRMEDYVPRGFLSNGTNPGAILALTSFGLDNSVNNMRLQDDQDEESVDLDLFSSRNESADNSEIAGAVPLQAEAEPGDHSGLQMQTSQTHLHSHTSSNGYVTSVSQQTSANDTMSDASSWLDNVLATFQQSHQTNQSVDAIGGQVSLFHNFSLGTREGEQNYNQSQDIDTQTMETEIETFATGIRSYNRQSQTQSQSNLLQGAPFALPTFRDTDIISDSSDSDSQDDWENDHDAQNDIAEASGSSVDVCFGQHRPLALRWSNNQRWHDTTRERWYANKLGNSRMFNP